MLKIKFLNRVALPLIGGFLVLSAAQFITPNSNEAKAYVATSLSDKNTIDLNDSTSEEIKNYYSSLSSMSSSEKQGNNLLKNLKTILKTDQVYFGYDSNMWKMYEITDRDLSKSPFTTSASNYTYNPSTNIITNYKYSSVDAYVRTLYVDHDLDNQSTAMGGHQAEKWDFNREHIWAKSHGFNNEGAGGARGDPMHLWPGNGKVNQAMHGNLMYGYVDTSRTYTSGSKYYDHITENLTGYAVNYLSGESENKVFEPQDSDKGDIARAIFYMAARYNFLSGTDTDGIDTNNPNLELTLSTDSSEVHTSSTTKKGLHGVVSDLLEWNRIDPPDEFEIHRNNLLFKNYTHNRNPFIDFPEWAEYVWGKPVYEGKRRESYDTTPTGSINLSTDIINGFKGDSGITISKTSDTVIVGNTTTLSASSNDSSSISWSTSNPSVASISASSTSSGATITITGVSVGDAVITATSTTDPTKYKTCSISVISSTPTVTSVNVTPSELSIEVSETSTLVATVIGTASPAQTVTWSSSDSTVATVDSNGLVTGIAAGTATITATSTVDTSKSGICSVTVNNAGEYSWNIVTKSSDLVSGGKYVIAAASNGKTAGALNSSYLTAIDSTFNNNKTAITSLGDGTVVFTLGGQSGAWTLANSSNQLLGSKKSLSLWWNDGTTTWSISIDASNNASIANTTSDCGTIFFNGSATPNRFKTYTTTSLTSVQLFKKVQSVVSVTGVSLDQSSLSICEGDTNSLTATVTPSNATDKTVTWSSSNSSIASVDENGEITAVNVGTAVITVTTNDGGYEASCDVTITEDEIEYIEIDKSVSKLSYIKNEQFNKQDIVVIAYYVHVSSKVIDNKDLTFSIDDNENLTTSRTLTVTYNHNSEIFDDDAEISVSECSGAIYNVSGKTGHTDVNVPAGSSASFTASYGQVMTAGNYMTLTLSGYVNTRITGISLLMKSNQSGGAGYVSCKANNTEIASIGDSSNPVSFDDPSFNGRFFTSYRYLNLSLNSPYVVRQGDTITINITSTENSLSCKSFNVQYEEYVSPTVQSLTLSGTYQTEFAVDETFNHDGMVVTANYSDSTSEDVTAYSTWSTPTMSEIGYKVVKVYFDTVFASYSINVGDTPLAYNKVTTEPTSWEGKFLLVYENPTSSSSIPVTSGKVWTGVNAVSCYVDTNISNGSISEIPSGATTLTIASMTDGYSIKVDSGTNKNKYIYGTNESNTMNFGTTASLNTLSITKNSASITSNTSVLRFNKASNQLTFKYFKSATYINQQPIQLYKLSSAQTDLQKAESYSSKMYECITCYNGSKTPTIETTTWAELATEFSNLTLSVKAYLVNATYTVSGNVVTPLGETTKKIAEGIARYDQLVGKYSQTYNNFMDRDIPTNNYPSLLQTNNDSSIIITVVAATISLLIVGGYFFICKRKKYNS